MFAYTWQVSILEIGVGVWNLWGKHRPTKKRVSAINIFDQIHKLRLQTDSVLWFFRRRTRPNALSNLQIKLFYFYSYSYSILWSWWGSVIKPLYGAALHLISGLSGHPSCWEPWYRLQSRALNPEPLSPTGCSPNLSLNLLLLPTADWN